MTLEKPAKAGGERHERVAAEGGVKPAVSDLPDRPEVKHEYATHDKIRQKLGFQGGTSLEEGIRRMAEWARSVGPRATAPFGHIAIDRNLPPSWRR